MDYGTPILGGRGGRGSAMAPLERAMVVSYRLSIVTVALSVSSRFAEIRLAEIRVRVRVRFRVRLRLRV